MANDMLHEQFLLKDKPKFPSLLTKSLNMSVTELNVQNIENMKRFYKEYVGLEIFNETKEKVVLGHKDKQIISLIQSEQAKSPVGSAGLYHNAIVYASRGELARTVQKMLDSVPHYYSGTADHLVSEAFYFTDPEGNGLELYFDKDKSSWQWQNGMIKMDSIYIDPIAYINKYASEDESIEKHMGHVHLKVGNIEEAKTFYVEVLGFDITAELESALFISVAGYHHNIGLNTWESYGAGKRSPSLGLHRFELILDSDTDIVKLKKRFDKFHIKFIEYSTTLIVSDPWNNVLVISSKK